CEVLAEIAVSEIRSAKAAFPVAVGTELIDHNGPLLAAMSGKIGLPVPEQIEPPGKDSALHGLLPDGRSDARSPPFHILWQPDIDGDHRVHADLLGLALRHFIVLKTLACRPFAPGEAISSSRRHSSNEG